MCLNSENVDPEDLKLTQALAESMGDDSMMGAFLKDIVNIIREGSGLCLGTPMQAPPPQVPGQIGLPPGWTMPNAN